MTHHGPAMIIDAFLIEELCSRALAGVVCDDNALMPLYEAMTLVEHEIAVRAMRSPTLEEFRLRNETLLAEWDERIEDEAAKGVWRDVPRHDRSDDFDTHLEAAS